MSKVWRRLQRVGKTAYKFEFTIKVHTVTLECVSGWTPNQVSVLWVRRGRKVRTEATSWTTLPGKDTQGVVNWHALEATITLYMDTNSQKKKFDDKYWTLIVENIGPNGKHKALATKRINMSQMADPSLHPQETRRKYRMKPVARKVHLTELQVTFISKFERQGPAIDDDMRSVTSEMSEMTFGGFEDGYMSENEYEPYNDTNPEENEQIMREIAAIGADFRQLSSFTDEGPNNNNNNNSFQANDVNSHEHILIAWASKETDSYNDIAIVDLKDSWGDGKAFCAIIHKYCPELIKMGQLNDPYSNVKQATKAAVELGLMPSIDPIDFHKRRLDKLSIITFVDQLYQNFKNAEPQAVSLMKHKELKKSPEHKRTTPSVLTNRKVELDETEEEKRRKDMIARGKLRASRRRPNRLDKSNTSLDTAKSPVPTPVPEVVTPTKPVVQETPPAPSSPGGSVTGSSGIIQDSPTHLVKCNVTSSFEADVFVSSSGGLDPDELMKEFQRQSPAVSPRPSEVDLLNSAEVESYQPELVDQQVIDAIVGAGSLRSLESGGRLSSEKISLKSDESADAIMESLEREVIHSPTSIRISGISSTSEEAAIDPSALSIKLNESKDEAAAFRESILSDKDEPETAEPEPITEVTPEPETVAEPEVDDMQSDFDELIKIKFSLEEPATPKIEEPVEETEHIETDIEAEIAELEIQLNSNFNFNSEVKQPDSPPEPSPVKETPPVVAPEEPSAPEEPALLQPTPPTTPPRSKRASSLRDKIRGLHSAREKLMSACPSPTISEDSNKSSKPPVLPKPIGRSLSMEKVSMLRSSSQESVKSRASSRSDSLSIQESEESVSKPVVTTPAVSLELLAQETPPAVSLELLAQETPPESPETVQDDLIPSVSVEKEIVTEQPTTEVKEIAEPPSEELAPRIAPVELGSECDLEQVEVAMQSPGEVQEFPLFVDTPEQTTPEQTTPEPTLEQTTPEPTLDEQPEQPKHVIKEPTPPSPRKPAGKEIQSLTELISSFSPKTEAETSFEETTTSTSRAESPSVEMHAEEPACNAAGSLANSVTSVNSEPPPPPTPAPLALMMGPPGEEDMSPVEEDDSEEETNQLNQSTLDKQDLQDVRNYMSECHARITHHNAKLDKRAKVLEKELRVAMDSQNHELEQKLLKSWLHLVHERNTLVRKQDDLNSLQNEEDLEERCCVVLKEMRRYQNMRDTTKTVHDVEREEQLEEEYRDILKKRELLLRIRDDINTVSMEEEAEFRSVIEKPKLLQDQSSCKVS